MGRVIQTLPGGEPIWGVTSLDNHLYVLREKSSAEIEVYDSDSYRLLSNWGLLGPVGGVRDIVACEHNRCAYISNCSQNCVNRVALPFAAGTAGMQWPVNDGPTCLSLTNTHSVLVTCTAVCKIKEFSTDGQLLRVLLLPQDFGSLMHTVQLSSGQFVVCYGKPTDPLRRVCLMGSDGSVVKSFVGPPGSGGQQTYSPFHVAVDRNEFVYLADVKYRRVYVLTPQLAFVREVVSQLQLYPVRVHLDSNKGRLYVAANNAKDGKFTAGQVFVLGI